MDAERKLRIIAEQHHGLVVNAQLRAIGWNRVQVQRRVQAGMLEPVAPGIYRIRGIPTSPLQRAQAAVLDAGRDGALAFSSACGTFELPRYEVEPLHVWRRRGRADHPDRLAIQHRTRRLMPNHVMLVHGIRVTSPPRTLIDMAAVLEPWETERLYEDMVMLGLTNHFLVDRMLCSLSKQGRTGLVIVRDLNAARGPHYAPAGSNLERRAQSIIEPEFGSLERQVNIEDEVGWIARVDFRLRRNPRVLVEVQSDRYHGALIDRAADRRRIDRLEASGRVVVEVREHEIWHDPQAVLVAVSEGLHRASADRRVA